MQMGSERVRIHLEFLTMQLPPRLSEMNTLCSQPQFIPKQQEQNVPSELSEKVAGKVGNVSGSGKLPRRISYRLEGPKLKKNPRQSHSYLHLLMNR